MVEAGPFAIRRRRYGRGVGGLAGGSGSGLPAGARSTQGSDQDRVAPRYVHRGTDDAVAARAIAGVGGGHRAGGVFRLVPLAIGYDLRATGRAGDGAPASDPALADGDFWRDSRAKA